MHRSDGTDKPYQVKQVRDIITTYPLALPWRCEVIIYWSEADAAFLAEVPELPGCMADGPTKVAALEAAEQIAREWMRTARDLGREVPEPHGGSRFTDRPQLQSASWTRA